MPEKHTPGPAKLKRCPAIGPAPEGFRCGLPIGHSGKHHVLIPTNMPWFPKAKAGRVRMPEKHTPGPWEVCEIGHDKSDRKTLYRVEINAPQYLYGKRTHSRHICTIVDYRDWTDQPANARLIAAAPELLEALKECLTCEFAVTETAVIDKAERAIAKAEGRNA